MSPRSMTGFARARRAEGGREAVAMVKTVNHRGLDIHFRMPGELDPCEAALRAAVKRYLSRGHVQVQMGYTAGGAAMPAQVNQTLLETYLRAFHRISAIHGLHTEPDLNLIFQMPGMFAPPETEPEADTERLLVETLEEALERLNEFREREGAEIVAEMRRRNATVLGCAGQMEEFRSRAVPEFQARLAGRMSDLLSSVDLDPQRLAQEVAYLVDRTDISEELTRLKVHGVQLDDLLVEGGEIGKKVDFMLQEMHRETNTILSKSTGVGETGLEITELALVAKAEIEKIREQGLNLE
jgi:uncharacterized protein (TIGR00255 family)